MLEEFFYEPDTYSDNINGFEVYAQRNRMKAWCGYVIIPEWHPIYGKDYYKTELQLQVHGGITYSGKLYWKRDAAGWAIGFNCSHYLDATPYEFFRYGECNGTYRTLEFVKSELRSLVDQLGDL